MPVRCSTLQYVFLRYKRPVRCLIGLVGAIVSIIKISSGCGLQAAFLLIEAMRLVGEAGIQIVTVGDEAKKSRLSGIGLIKIQAFEQFQAA